MITVKELIEKLKEYPEDMPVKVYATYDYGYAAAGGDVDYIVKYEDDYAVILHNDEG